MLLLKHNRLAPEVSIRALEMKNKRNQSLRGPVMVGVLVERTAQVVLAKPFKFNRVISEVKFGFKIWKF